MAHIALQEISASYGSHEVIHHISLLILPMGIFIPFLVHPDAANQQRCVSSQDFSLLIQALFC